MVFATTRWSVILNAQGAQEEEASIAVNDLCEAYWFPLYSFVRRRGYSEHEAQDLTQEFFRHFLEKHWIQRADKQRGRFRSFLLTCMKNFLANDWDRTHAHKRGGDQIKLSLDFERGEGILAEMATEQYSPEALYDRHWAQTLFARSLREIQTEYEGSGRGELYRAIKGSLTSGQERHRHAQLAQQMNMTEGAVTVAVHRLRKRFGEKLRDEIAHTLADPGEVDQELKYLISLL